MSMGSGFGWISLFNLFIVNHTDDKGICMSMHRSPCYSRRLNNCCVVAKCIICERSCQMQSESITENTVNSICKWPVTCGFIFQVQLYGGLKCHRHILNAVKFKRCSSLWNRHFIKIIIFCPLWSPDNYLGDSERFPWSRTSHRCWLCKAFKCLAELKLSEETSGYWNCGGQSVVKLRNIFHFVTLIQKLQCKKLHLYLGIWCL